MPVGGAPVIPIDKSGNVIGGSAASAEYVRAVNTQSRQANTAAMPAFFILAKDVNNADALIGVSAVSRAADGLATNQVTVATTVGGTQIIPARIGRSAVTITNFGTTDVYLGNSGVTTTTGSLLVGTKGASVTIPTSAAIFGIVATGTQAVSYTETF